MGFCFVDCLFAYWVVVTFLSSHPGKHHGESGVETNHRYTTRIELQIIIRIVNMFALLGILKRDNCI